MKYYWLQIEPFVYFKATNNKSVYYNTINHQNLVFDSKFISALTKQLSLKKNMNIIKISEDIKNNCVFIDFLLKIRSLFMGDLIDANWAKTKPVQFVPTSKLLKIDGIENLEKINIRITNDCEWNCKSCSIAYKQVRSCGNNGRNESLELNNLHQKLLPFKDMQSLTYYISGGNLFRYRNFPELVLDLNKFTGVKSYVINYLNWDDVFFNLNPENYFINIIVNFPINDTCLDRILKNSHLMQHAIIQFNVTSESEYKQYIEILNHYSIQNSVVRPLSIGNNLDFFKHHVFLDQEDILSQQLSFKEIIARSLFSSKFGEISIEPNGDLYLGNFANAYGNINDESITTIVNSAMNEHKCFWFKTKKSVLPCKKCLYQDLCPQISNYEIAMKRYNLCNVNSEHNHA